MMLWSIVKVFGDLIFCDILKRSDQKLWMNKMLNELTFRASTKADSVYIKEIMEQYWGGEPLLVRDKNYYPSTLPGFFAFSGDELAGFLFYEPQGDDCEIVVFEVFNKHQGTGSRLLNLLITQAKKHSFKRIYLMTHNDNLDALRFYQRRGFSICGIRINSMDCARMLKPSIPLIGDYGIPIRDEIDLEMLNF